MAINFGLASLAREPHLNSVREARKMGGGGSGNFFDRCTAIAPNCRVSGLISPFSLWILPAAAIEPSRFAAQVKACSQWIEHKAVQMFKNPTGHRKGRGRPACMRQ